MRVLRRPDRVDLQDEEHNGEHCQNNEADDRPALQNRFRRLALVLAEEGLARAAEGVDALRVAGLKKDEDDRGEGRHEHEDDEDSADGDVGRICSVRTCGCKQIDMKSPRQ